MRDHLDTQIRELTFKLVHLAPEAPPFPEVSMAKLTSEKQTSSPRPPRRPSAAWAAAAAFVVVLLIGVPLLFFRGDPEPVAPATTVTTVPDTTPTTVPVAVTSFDVTVYYLADYVEASNVPGPHLVPLRRNVSTSSPAGEADLGDQVGAAIRALIDGPSTNDAALIAGISSAIPEGTELLGLTLDRTGDSRGVVLDFNPAFESGGGTFSMGARLAQVVYTATQFGDVDSVEFTIDGETVDVFSSEGLLLDGPQARDDYRDLLPLIFVEQPLPGDTVTSPIEIVGVANTFEASLEYRIEMADGTLLSDGWATASCGTGCWGDYSLNAPYTLAAPSTGYVVLFESSAQDGRPVNVVRIPVNLEPAEGSTEGLYVEAYGAYDDGVPFGAPLNGAVVVQSRITIYGFTNVATQLTVNGETVPVTNEAFEFTVELSPGVNEIVLEDGVLDSVFSVTYLPNGERQFGFVANGVTDESGTIEGPDGTIYTTPVLLAVDYAQWLSGDAANQAAFEDGVIGSVDERVPNDYYIRNENPDLRSMPVRPDVSVYLVDFDLILPVPVALDVWLDLVDQGGDGSYFNAGSPLTSYWFVLDGEGYIVQIVQQQYVPEL